MKIIYIFERRHYYKYDDEMFGINYFKEVGFEVEVWSAVYWSFSSNAEEPLNIHEGSLIYINDEAELITQLRRVKQEECFFILYPYHIYAKMSYLIRKNIVKEGFRFANLTQPSNLFGYKPLPEKKKLYMKASKDLIYSLIALVVRKIPFIYVRYKKTVDNLPYQFWGPVLYKSTFNFVITKNQYNYLPNLFEFFSKRNVLVPSLDYSEYLKTIKTKKEETNVPSAVFIDQYLAGHSDFAKAGRLAPVQSPQLYYKEMDAFFTRIENELGIKVIIAAHPKAEYEGNEYGGRELRYFETVKLIRNAELVLFNYSTAISWVLLFKKKFLHIGTSQELSDENVRQQFITCQKLLDSKLMNISEINKDTRIKEYINDYRKQYDDLLEAVVVPQIGMKKDCFTIMAEKIRNLV